MNLRSRHLDLNVGSLSLFCEEKYSDRFQVGLEEEEARSSETTCNRLEWSEVI